ncbi:hypothetical protein MPER_11996, partial [Moniliophthora perniciosa FA553]
MGRSKSEIWNHFIRGEKQNGSHHEAYCRWCIAKRASVQLGKDETMQLQKTEAWVITVMADMHRENDEMRKKGEKNDSMKGVVTGKKESMVPHILNCPNASAAAKNSARELKKGAKEKKRMNADDEEGEKAKQQTKKRELPTNLIKFLREPFTDIQVEKICAQIEKATVSASLPGGWFEGLEVIKLFRMIYEMARDAMPSRPQAGGGEWLDEVEAVDEDEANIGTSHLGTAGPALPLLPADAPQRPLSLYDEAKDRAERFTS